jgi:hypothetical protein
VGCSYSVIGIAGRSEFPALTRVAHHARTRTDWNRELLVRRDTSDGFNSAEAGWLEGRLADVLELAPAAKLTMGRRDRDESLPEYERDSLEQMIRPITAVMRAIDASPDTPDQGPPLRPPNKRKPGSLKDLLEAGLLKAGAKLRPVSSATTRARPWRQMASSRSAARPSTRLRVPLWPSLAARERLDVLGRPLR